MWPKVRVLEVLQDAATYCYPLTKKQYEELRAVGAIDGPPISTIAARFGTWSQACEAAGVEFVKSAADVEDAPWVDQSPWTEQDLWRYVRTYLAEGDAGGTLYGLGIWLKNQPGAPRQTTHFTKRLGRWAEIKAAVLDGAEIEGPSAQQQSGN